MHHPPWHIFCSDINHYRRNVKFFSSTASALQRLVGEEKFAPALEKNISLTWAQNFLSEVGSSKEKVKNGK